jgi:hypothetical protein
LPKYNIINGGLHHQFLRSRKKIQVLAGGFGNGKTAAACVKAIQLCKDYPGCNGLIARETYPKLNDTIRKEFYKWCPPDSIKRWPTKDDNTLIFKNGSVVNFRYIAQRGKQTVDGQATSNLLSATYDWVVVDQMEDPQIQHKDLLDLLGRLRGSTPYKGDDPTMPMSGPRWIILTANPTANWFYKKLIKPYHRWRATGLVTEDLIHDPVTLEPLMAVFEGSTYENAHNLDPDFISGLEASYKGQMRQRFLMGEWAAYEGLVYPSFISSTHMIPKSHILEMLEPIRRNNETVDNFECFDFGIVNPSCYLCGFIDEMGRVVVVDGFYKAHLGLDDIADRIQDIRSEYDDVIDFSANPIWSDPAIFKKTVVRGGAGRTTDTVAKILMEKDEGFFFRPGQNDKVQGITKVTEYLVPRVGMHYIPTEKEGPLIYFCDRLTFVEDEIVAYFWKTSTEGERIDEPKDGNDHAMDALKYGVSRLPEASSLHFVKPKTIPEWMKWQEIEDGRR